MIGKSNIFNNRFTPTNIVPNFTKVYIFISYLLSKKVNDTVQTLTVAKIVLNSIVCVDDNTKILI